MEFSVKSGVSEKQRMLVLLCVFEPRRLSPVAEQLDKISDGYISSLLAVVIWKENLTDATAASSACVLSERLLSVVVKSVNWVNASIKKLFKKHHQ